MSRDAKTIVRAYHEQEHGDRVISIRTVKMRRGGDYYLVRVLDENGKRWSCLDTVYYTLGAVPYACQEDFCLPDEEDAMLHAWRAIDDEADEEARAQWEGVSS